MIKVAICDDDYHAAVQLEEWIMNVAIKNLFNTEADIFSDGLELIHELNQKCQYDIIFLDIEMGTKNGIETAKEIRKFDKNVILVYVSGYEAYAIEAFEVNPYRFLVKPVDKIKFEKIFLESVSNAVLEEVFFRYKYEKAFFKENISDILYFESDRRIINIVTNHASHKFYGILNEVETRLSPAKTTFLRIHQSYLVNYRYINKISYDFVEMSNGDILSISEDKQKAISSAYFKIIERNNLLL